MNNGTQSLYTSITQFIGSAKSALTATGVPPAALVQSCPADVVALYATPGLLLDNVASWYSGNGASLDPTLMKFVRAQIGDVQINMSTGGTTTPVPWFHDISKCPDVNDVFSIEDVATGNYMIKTGPDDSTCTSNQDTNANLENYFTVLMTDMASNIQNRTQSALMKLNSLQALLSLS